MKTTTRHFLTALFLLTLAVSAAFSASAQSTKTKMMVRIKDVARMAGNESYDLIGYSIVTGLNGTGASDSTIVQRTLANMMQNFNIIINEQDLKAKNISCVVVTAKVKGKAHKGDMIEAEVSTIDDAKSLYGGTLVLTSLFGADGKVWATAQGPVTTGGYVFGNSGAGGNTNTKNHPTAGYLTNGAKLLKDIGHSLKDKDIITYYLAQPDFTAAVKMTESINSEFFGSAQAIDAATIRVRVPNDYKDEDRVALFASKVEQLYFESDSVARVVFNEKTGTIVVGADVRISEAAVSHGNIYVNVKEFLSVSQPTAFSIGGQTVTIPDSQVTTDEQRAKFLPVPNTTTVLEMVQILNALGVTPRDIMMIFHALRAAGALHAQLEAL